MKKLKFEYGMKLRFSSPVNSHAFALRCVPGDSSRQRIRLTECRVEPADWVVSLRDGFGNIRLAGGCSGPHETFGFLVAGTAVTEGMGVRAEPLHPMYRYPSRYTGYAPEVESLAGRIREEWRKQEARTELERAVCAMHYLYGHFAYVRGVTDIGTTAAEALRLKGGVCQDYAHIMTALMRFLGIPARYVSGLMIGEGYSHAWVEIYTDGGWYGLDPTNDLHVDEYYIKLAHGRDYGDCVVDQGRFLGNVSQEQIIHVNVEEITDDRDSGIDGASGG